MKVFADSSALSKLYIDEPGSLDMQSICAQATQMGVCVIALPEVISALNRRRRGSDISSSHYRKAKERLLADMDGAEVVNLTPGIVSRSLDLLENNALRAMDALHVASAMEWGCSLFVSSDEQQLAAATKAGLKTKAV